MRRHSGKTSKKSAKVAKKAAAKRVAPPPSLPPPRRRQPSDREGRWQRPRAGLHRGHAGLETRRRTPPRRAHRARRAQRAQGREVELALLWHGGPRLVPRLPLLHEVRQGGLLPRHVAASTPPGGVQAQGRALSRHPRGRQLDEDSWRVGSGRHRSCPAGSRSASSALWPSRVQCHGGANERLQRLFINLVALMEIDGTPGVAFEAGVEEA